MAVSDAAPAPGAVSASASAPRARALEFMGRRHRFHLGEALPWILMIAAFFLFPDRVTFGTQVLIAIMFTLSLDLILGYAGIVTLGHAAFFGIGAYTVALLSARLHWGEPISALAAGALLAALAGFISGWFLLRYRGLTLLMLTLATAILVQELGNYRSDITGGYDGVPGMEIWPLLGLFENDLFGRTYYIYVAILLLLIFYVIRRIVYSPFGQALTGIRENVRRMHAIGSPVHRRLVASYTLAAAIAGAAGALLRGSAADFFDMEGIDPATRVEPRDARKAAVDDDLDSVDRERSFRHVCRHNRPALFVMGERRVLLGRRQFAVERQDDKAIAYT